MKTVYNEFGLGGNLVALGGNLWNTHVGAAVRDSKDRHEDLRLAAQAFFDKVLPEMQNFMEQKIAHELKRSNLQLSELKKVMGGRTGKGHFIQSSGRVDCPECHSPSVHSDACKYGAALLRPNISEQKYNPHHDDFMSCDCHPDIE